MPGAFFQEGWYAPTSGPYEQAGRMIFTAPRAARELPPAQPHRRVHGSNIEILRSILRNLVSLMSNTGDEHKQRMTSHNTYVTLPFGIKRTGNPFGYCGCQYMELLCHREITVAWKVVQAIGLKSVLVNCKKKSGDYVFLPVLSVADNEDQRPCTPVMFSRMQTLEADVSDRRPYVLRSPGRASYLMRNISLIIE
ncbi:hypothetical protein NDU88_003362 [Pleurodeles waltl]|uniref:Uncharacterized protein n=1 Tax=Pleurodeles waltl TaxID=8319 RepID=A0AAV7W543_PLEWA|nr:hypothetical protein NDU88_003362 [Pleurodeles waltl]